MRVDKFKDLLLSQDSFLLVEKQGYYFLVLDHVIELNHKSSQQLFLSLIHVFLKNSIVYLVEF